VLAPWLDDDRRRRSGAGRGARCWNAGDRSGGQPGVRRLGDVQCGGSALRARPGRVLGNYRPGICGVWHRAGIVYASLPPLPWTAAVAMADGIAAASAAGTAGPEPRWTGLKPIGTAGRRQDGSPGKAASTRPRHVGVLAAWGPGYMTARPQQSWPRSDEIPRAAGRGAVLLVARGALLENAAGSPRRPPRTPNRQRAPRDRPPAQRPTRVLAPRRSGPGCLEETEELLRAGSGAQIPRRPRRGPRSGGGGTAALAAVPQPAGPRHNTTRAVRGVWTHDGGDRSLRKADRSRSRDAAILAQTPRSRRP